MNEIRLARSGKRQLVFIGEEIFDGSTKTHDSTRWSVVRVFETEKDFVIGIAHLTCWDGERDSFSAEKRETPGEVINLITEKVPELEEQLRSAFLELGYNENGKSYDTRREAAFPGRDGASDEDLP